MKSIKICNSIHTGFKKIFTELCHFLIKKHFLATFWLLHNACGTVIVSDCFLLGPFLYVFDSFVFIMPGWSWHGWA